MGLEVALKFSIDFLIVSSLSFRNGGYNVRVLQRYNHSVLCDSDCVGGRSVRCHLLSYKHFQTSLVEVSGIEIVVLSSGQWRKRIALANFLY